MTFDIKSITGREDINIDMDGLQSEDLVRWLHSSESHMLSEMWEVALQQYPLPADHKVIYEAIRKGLSKNCFK